jgi:hypothetical protein
LPPLIEEKRQTSANLISYDNSSGSEEENLSTKENTTRNASVLDLEELD